MDILNWCLAHWREVLGCIILIVGVVFVSVSTRNSSFNDWYNDRRKR